ncbi:hypothetical protein VU07_02355 [Desulfobulbus sp. F4]|nr:hypothetical protein [Desulfobulbus sp. F4]
MRVSMNVRSGWGAVSTAGKRLKISREKTFFHPEADESGFAPAFLSALPVIASMTGTGRLGGGKLKR